MLIDTSALVAMPFEEPEADRMRRAAAASPGALVAAPTLVETTAVVLARTRNGAVGIQRLFERLGVELIGMSVEAAREAQRAYARYGKGVGSPGVLNFGDCLVYGIARTLDEPLLFTGDDFAATDVRAAPY